jgi:uncharacterized protein YqjF (DUF2071 family)
MTPTAQQRLAARLPDPGAKPVMFQHWADLLFLHWEYPAETLRDLLPTGLHLDTHEGKAYLGIVPFFMSDIRPRFLPAVPWLSKFQELNLRTYVYDDEGTPGVWFLTLDAANPIAVALARTFFHLPYRLSCMSATGRDKINYESHPCNGRKSNYVYPRPTNGIEAAPDTLEFFLLERYFLFAHNPKRDRLYRGQVIHAPYRFSLTSAKEWSTNPITECGLPAPEGPPTHQAVASGFDVRILPLQRLR